MAAQAGWYVDPRDARQYRYWDGERWSQSTQPIPELDEHTAINGEATGSLSAGGAKEPVGADAFDGAAAESTGADDDVLADFMWTSGFGESPDDPAANAGPTMFTPEPAAVPSEPTPVEPVAVVPDDRVTVPEAPSMPVFGAPTEPEHTGPTASGGSLFAPIDPSVPSMFDPSAAVAPPPPPAPPAPPVAEAPSVVEPQGDNLEAPERSPFTRPDMSEAAGGLFSVPQQSQDLPLSSATRDAAPTSEKAKPEKPRKDKKEKAAKRSRRADTIVTPPKPQSGALAEEKKSALPVLLGLLAVIVLGAAAFLLLSGGDDEPDTNVAGTTVEKSTTTAADAAATTAAETSDTTVPAGSATTVAAASDQIAGYQAAFEAEAARACDVIKADPGLLTENVIAYDPAWEAIPKTYTDLQASVNTCTFEARDEALKRVAAAEAARNAGG